MYRKKEMVAQKSQILSQVSNPFPEWLDRKVAQVTVCHTVTHTDIKILDIVCKICQNSYKRKKEILCQVSDPFDVNHPEWLDRRGGVVTQALAV